MSVDRVIAAGKRTWGRGCDLAVLGVVLLVAGWVFAPIGHHQFVTYDGEMYVTKNAHVQAGLTRESILWAFTTIYSGNWHPLTWLSHMLDVQLYGMNPAGHHWTSLALHLISTALLFGLLRRLTGAPVRSAAVAALFAIHPLHVESVAWIAERKDVLSTVFWMLTMWAYVRYTDRPGVGRYLLVCLALALGLLAKAMLVTLPFVLLLLDYWPLKRMSGEASGAWPHLGGDRAGRVEKWGLHARVFGHLWMEKIPLFGLVAVVSVVTLMAQGAAGSVASLDRVSGPQRIANAVVSYATYVVKAVWPTHLAVFYPLDPNGVSVERLLGALAFLIAITLWATAKARTSPYLVVGWLWYLGTLVPVIGLVQVGQQAMADRYTYVPLIGVFIMLVWTLFEILDKSRGRRVAGAVVATGLLFALVYGARTQVRFWADDMTLFQHALEVTERNHVAHYMVAREMLGRGDQQEAKKHYVAALEFKPDWSSARNNLAVLLEKEGKVDDAIEQYRTIIRYTPGYGLAHNNLGVLLAGKGRYAEAMSHYETALTIDPTDVDAHRNLGLLLLRQGRSEEAARHLFQVPREEGLVRPVL